MIRSQAAPDHAARYAGQRSDRQKCIKLNAARVAVASGVAAVSVQHVEVDQVARTPDLAECLIHAQSGSVRQTVGIAFGVDVLGHAVACKDVPDLAYANHRQSSVG